MSEATNKSSVRSTAEFARMVVSVAQTVKVDVILCVTESGCLAQSVHNAARDLPLVVTTPSTETYENLSKQGFDVITLPISVVSKNKQALHAISVAL